MHYENVISALRLDRLIRLSLLLGSAFAVQANAGDPVVDQHQLGTQYSPLTQINRDNVARLERACEFHTGDAAKRSRNSRRKSRKRAG